MPHVAIDLWTPGAIVLAGLLLAVGMRGLERLAHMRAARRTREAIDRALDE